MARLVKKLCGAFALLWLLAAASVLAETPVKDALWIDVRSAEEYASGHIEQAINIPHTEIADKIATLQANKDKTIYVYCRSGRRSGLAKESLEKLGYSNVINLGGLEDAKKFLSQ